jgi:preprotein translocase subunit YajC
MEMLIMLGIFGLVFYFLIYRPQAKRVKEHKNLMSALAKGDEVLTAGGLVGKIVKVSDDKDFVVVALNDQANVTVQKGSISAVLPKGTMKAL